MKTADVFHESVIESDAPKESHPGLNFRSWRYTTVKALLGDSEEAEDMCLDTGCGASLIDRDFLAQKIPGYQNLMKQKSEAIRVRDIDNAMLSSSDYLSLRFRLPGELKQMSAIASFTRHAYIVDKLKAKVLISNDIIEPEKIVPNVAKGTAVIGSCHSIETKLNVTNCGAPIKRAARAAGGVRIPAHTAATIPFKLRGSTELPIDRDFMFIPQRLKQLGHDGGILSHIVDAHTIVMQMRNINEKNVLISKNARLDIIQKYEKKGCYFARSKNSHLTTNSEAHRS